MNWYAIFLCKSVFLASHFSTSNIYLTSSRDHHSLINIASLLILAWAQNVSSGCATIQWTHEFQETVVIVMSNPLLGTGQFLISSFHITDSSLSIYSSVYAHGQADPTWWSGLPLPMMCSVSHVCVCCFSPVHNKASDCSPCSIIILPSFLQCAEAVLPENCCIAISLIILISWQRRCWNAFSSDFHCQPGAHVPFNWAEADLWCVSSRFPLV